MLDEIAGITQIQKLYLQLLYKCNFNCQHCFHGEALQKLDVFSPAEVALIVSLFLGKYNITSVTLLGGEPFLHPNLLEIVRDIKSKGLRVEICTNGYGIRKKLHDVSPFIDHLRVSIEGLQEANDEVRRPGSFEAAEDTIRLAQQIGIETSVTTTVNTRNIDTLREYLVHLSSLGVRHVKLHSLRLIGNAVLYPHLAEFSENQLRGFEEALMECSKTTGMNIVVDEDLDPNHYVVGSIGTKQASELERVEVSPNGDIYISCKAVGSKANAFRYVKADNRIVYRPNAWDELQTPIPQVQYSALGA